MDIVRYEAAGGIVFEGDRLLLLRKTTMGEVVLPKGHVDAGESAEAAAVRETIEETGFANVDVLADLGELQAQFPFKGEWYIRTEHYFVMRLRDRTPAGPADYDDADYDKATYEHVWVKLEEAAGLMSFEPARSFVRRAVSWWKGKQP